MENKDKAPENQEPTKQELNVAEVLEKIKDKPEFAAYLNNYREQVVSFAEGEIGRKAMGKGWKEVDDAVLSALGLEKRPEGMNTSQFAAHVAKEKKALEDKLKALEGKEQEAPKQDEEAKKLYEAQMKQLRDELEQVKESKNQLLEREYNSSITNSINSFLADKTFKQSYTKEDLAELRETRINGIIQRSKKVDDRTIYYNKNNEPYMTNGLPMTAQEVAAVEFSSMFQVKTKGGNADGDDTTAVVKGDILTMANTNNIKTFAEFMSEFGKAMQVKGWAKHEDRYIKLAKATQDHYFPNGLPMG